MKLTQDSLLGLVFFGGLALIGWATLHLTSLSLEEKPRLVVYFDHAQGLRVGDAVFVLGKRMGQVREVALAPAEGQPPIRVELELDTAVPLTSGRRIVIRDSSLLGGKQVDIDPGQGEPQPPGQRLAGEDRVSAIDALGEADLGGTVASIKRFFDKLTDPAGSVGALLESRAAFDDLAAAIHSARASLAQIEKGEGTLGTLIWGRQLAEDLTASASELRQLVHKVNAGEGFVARLVNDRGMADDLAQAVADLRHLTAALRNQDGTLGRLVYDRGMAEKLDDTLTAVRSAVVKLDDPEAGLAGALLGDPRLRDDARALVADLADAASKLTSGQGLLAKMLNDPELGEKLGRLFTQVTGAIEDVREAAPVGTFFQVLSTPF